MKKDIIKILIANDKKQRMEKERIINEIQSCSFLSTQDKEVYSEIIDNFEEAKAIVEESKNKTIGSIRKALAQELGVAPAIMFSFADQFTTPRNYWELIKGAF